MWTISDLKSKASYVLKNCCYWKAVLVGFIFMAVGGMGSGGGSAGSSAQNNGFGEIDSSAIIAIMVIVLLIVIFAMALGFVFSAFVTNPLIVGCDRFFASACVQDTNVNEVGFAFGAGRYMNVVKAMFSMTIEIFLWSLLLIIPGIIKKYQYRMIPYLLAENPNMTGAEAKALSSQMMDGEKMNAFLLDLSFIGWHLLSICTCGILYIFWTTPYICLTNAELYLVLKEKIVSVNPY